MSRITHKAIYNFVYLGSLIKSNIYVQEEAEKINSRKCVVIPKLNGNAILLSDKKFNIE